MSDMLIIGYTLVGIGTACGIWLHTITQQLARQISLLEAIKDQQIMQMQSHSRPASRWDLHENFDGVFEDL
jgi:hypothetical protein